jgi:hypothetical protein
MTATVHRTLKHLSSTRDLRAEMLALAADLTGNRSSGRLDVSDPVISAETVNNEWQRLLPAIAPDIRERMTLSIATRASPAAGARSGAPTSLPLDRPNYRHEVLRLLIGADLEDDGPQSIKSLIERIGASQTPIRSALADLKRANVVYPHGRGIETASTELSAELLARLGALPQTFKFRFERGAQLRPPPALLDRALTLLGANSPPSWASLSLSGVPVALADVPDLDLAGLPRLDLVASLPRECMAFDAAAMRLLDDGLEPEPNLLEPAPVVVTVVRADTRFDRDAGVSGARCAWPMDVFLSLLDIGLRAQALQYVKAVRRA